MLWQWWRTNHPGAERILVAVVFCARLTPHFALTVGIQAISVALAALGLRRFPLFATLLTTAMLFVFPLMADTSDWNWFDFTKRYTLLVSAFLWAFASALPRNRWARRVVGLFPFVLMLNVLEAAALDLLGPSPLNGTLLLCVALCGPLTLHWDSGYRGYGFRNVYWQAAFVLTLGRLYVLNPEFENGFVAAMIALMLPSALCLLERDTHNWITWRIYTIYPLLLQDATLPKLSDLVYPEVLHAANRVKWQSMPVFQVWLAIGAALTALMILNRLGVARKRAERFA